MPNPLPLPRHRPKPIDAPPPSTPPRKRPLDAEADGDMPPKKRSKKNGFLNVNLASPSKKRRLEEDGLLMLEGPDENIDEGIPGEDISQIITIDD